MPLSPADIPKTLWLDDRLHVPPTLLRHHLADLRTEGLLELARKHTSEIGGGTREEFRRHYATLFRNGACRIAALFLDPHAALDSIPHELQATLTAGRICIVDAPSGACTASLGLLSVLVELRVHGAMPKLPLTVRILAGDLSRDALTKGEELLSALTPVFRRVGITATLTTQLWDATDPETTKRFTRWVEANTKPSIQRLILCESFSGATSDKKPDQAATRFGEFSHSFAHLLTSFADGRTTSIWLEPAWSPSKHMFKFLERFLDTLFPSTPAQRARAEHEYKWFESLGTQTLPCRIRVLKYAQR